MGVRFPGVSSTVIQNATMTQGAEVVVATTPLLILPLDNALVYIMASILFAVGSTSSTYTPRFRRGTTTAGTQINTTQTPNCTATQGVNTYLHYVDVPGAVGQIQYSLTMAMAAGGTNSTCLDVCISAFVL